MIGSFLLLSLLEWVPRDTCGWMHTSWWWWWSSSTYRPEFRYGVADVRKSISSSVGRSTDAGPKDDLQQRRYGGRYLYLLASVHRPLASLEICTSSPTVNPGGPRALPPPPSSSPFGRRRVIGFTTSLIMGWDRSHPHPLPLQGLPTLLDGAAVWVARRSNLGRSTQKKRRYLIERGWRCYKYVHTGGGGRTKVVPLMRNEGGCRHSQTWSVAWVSLLGQLTSIFVRSSA